MQKRLRTSKFSEIQRSNYRAADGMEQDFLIALIIFFCFLLDITFLYASCEYLVYREALRMSTFHIQQQAPLLLLLSFLLLPSTMTCRSNKVLKNALISSWKMLAHQTILQWWVPFQNFQNFVSLHSVLFSKNWTKFCSLSQCLLSKILVKWI